jgi:hypothetical protein
MCGDYNGQKEPKKGTFYNTIQKTTKNGLYKNHLLRRAEWKCTSFLWSDPTFVPSGANERFS